MKKMLLLIFLLTATAMQAQEKIDRMMEHFSATGSAQYNSIVIRNPETKAIAKIVKTLKINNTLKTDDFYRAFQEEKKNALYSESRQMFDTKSLTLIFQKETESRIYLLETEKSRMQVQLIITKGDPAEK